MDAKTNCKMTGMQSMAGFGALGAVKTLQPISNNMPCLWRSSIDAMHNCTFMSMNAWAYIVGAGACRLVLVWNILFSLVSNLIWLCENVSIPDYIRTRQWQLNDPRLLHNVWFPLFILLGATLFWYFHNRLPTAPASPTSANAIYLEMLSKHAPETDR